MDKLQKVLNNFTDKEKKQIKKILSSLKQRDFKGLDLKKLQGHNNIFRVRKGKIRIIFTLKENKFYLITIGRRSEKIYNL